MQLVVVVFALESFVLVAISLIRNRPTLASEPGIAEIERQLIQVRPNNVEIGTPQSSLLPSSRDNNYTEIKKLRYLSLVYNETVTDSSLFDRLDMIYRNPSAWAMLPQNLIPCITFVYGYDCIDYYTMQCVFGFKTKLTGTAGNDQTYLAETRWPPRRAAAVKSGQWAEVTHWGMKEGEGYGCFFNVRRGSGVFMNVGRTLIVQDDSFALAFFKKVLNVTIEPGYADYCPHARKLGYDTVQILNWVELWGPKGGHGVHQMIYCGGKCETDIVKSSCIPGLEMRTGLNHQLPCRCDPSISLLNCGNAIAPRVRRAKFCTEWAWANVSTN